MHILMGLVMEFDIIIHVLSGLFAHVTMSPSELGFTQAGKKQIFISVV